MSVSTLSPIQVQVGIQVSSSSDKKGNNYHTPRRQRRPSINQEAGEQGQPLLVPLPIVTPRELFLSQDRTASNRRLNAIDDDSNEQDRIQIQKSSKALLQVSPTVSGSGSVGDIDSDDGCGEVGLREVDGSYKIYKIVKNVNKK